jgi:2-dehydro-3-deoxyphosphooctonate aldolase (KDO 8-P synthase)
MTQDPSKNNSKMTLLVGPCVIEDEAFVQEVAQELRHQLKEIAGIDLYFKASFDKANRTSIESFRGPGLEKGLKILERVRDQTGLKLCTDFHTPPQAMPVAQVVDFLQIPAFLCRQTDMIVAGAEAALHFKRQLNIKKGQFLAPWDAGNIVKKVREIEAREKRKSKDPVTGPSDWFCLSERGVTFGYNTLVVDMLSFQCMKAFGVPVIYDATHSIQTPGGASGGKTTGGKREYLEVLARAAMAAGADGLFMECHPRPHEAKSDGPNAFPLEKVGAFVRQLLKIKALVGDLPPLISKELL